MLLMTVFTVKSCEFLIDYYTAYKSCDIENTNNDETRGPDTNEDCFNKSAKKLFSYFENDLNVTVTWATPPSTFRCVYSYTIFKEPLRDVLTPPPLHIA